MNDDLNSYKFNRFTLRYADKDLEKSFVSQHDEENRLLNRIANVESMFILLIVIGYTILFQKDQIFKVSLPILFVIYPYLCLAIVVTFIKRLTFIYQAVSGFSNLLVGLMMVYLTKFFISSPQITTYFIVGYIVGAFFVIGLRFSFAVPITLAYLILFEIGLLLPHRFPPDAVYASTSVIWGVELCLISSAYLVEKSVRKVFLQNLIITGQRKTIEIEKERSEGLLRKQLSHAEKLATMGTVVASVAHEINNPNNSLMLDAQLNQNAWKSATAVLDEHAHEIGEPLIGGFAYGEFKSAIADLSDRMKRNTDRIKHIVENLRAIAKKDADFNEDVDLNATVRSALSVVEYFTSRYTRNLDTRLGDSLPHIRGNIQCLEQVIVNLVKNACQSLPTIEKGVFISTAFEPKKNAVSFTIRDQGKGMDEATLKEIFTPYYTTKGKEGTGLGLSICDNIIRNHGGTINVESKLGEGTTVKFLLPLAAAPAEIATK